MRNADARVRRRGAEAYILLPEPDRMAPLARLLDDPHPGVRRSITSALLELTHRPELQSRRATR